MFMGERNVYERDSADSGKERPSSHPFGTQWEAMLRCNQMFTYREAAGFPLREQNGRYAIGWGRVQKVRGTLSSNLQAFQNPRQVQAHAGGWELTQVEGPREAGWTLGTAATRGPFQLSRCLRGTCSGSAWTRG